MMKYAQHGALLPFLPRYAKHANLDLPINFDFILLVALTVGVNMTE
jgi:hypothetical protein